MKKQICLVKLFEICCSDEKLLKHKFEDSIFKNNIKYLIELGNDRKLILEQLRDLQGSDKTERTIIQELLKSKKVDEIEKMVYYISFSSVSMQINEVDALRLIKKHEENCCLKSLEEIKQEQDYFFLIEKFGDKDIF